MAGARRPLAALGLILMIAAIVSWPEPALADGALTQVGADALGARGLNAGLAVADHCAYVGSRGQGPVAVIDVIDPAHPTTVGELGARSLTTTREVRAVPDQHLLIVMSYALAPGGANRYDFYRWDTECGHPQPVGSYQLPLPPHEFYLWRGGGRTLLFTSMFHGGAGDLQIVDASDPAAPHLAGTWDSPIGLLHSMALSSDGARIYLSLWRGGMLVGDVSDFTAGRPGAALRLLTSPANALPAAPGGNVHSAVPVPGRPLVVITDERYPPSCPFGPARMADVSDPAHPREVSSFAPPNMPCSPGTYTSHNPTMTPNLAFITWYSNGLQVFDISDPAHPALVASYLPTGPEPGQRSLELGVGGSMTWSYPIIRGDLIYVADIDQGLHILRYAGPRQEEVAQLAFSEGNSNLTALRPPPTPTPSATPSIATPRASPARHSDRGTVPWPMVGLAALVVVGLAAAGVWLRRRR